MSKRVLEYESETVLPDSFEQIIAKYERLVMADKYEPDKQFLHFSSMRREIILYFANFSKEHANG